MSFDSPRPDRRMFALGLRLFAVSCLATMSMLIKLASQSGIKLPELMFWRQFLALPVVLVWVLPSAGIGSLRTFRFPMHLRRAMLGLTGMAFTFGAVILLPLAEATTLGFTVPIFATILSALFLGESVGRHRWAAVLAGFAGVLIVVAPGKSDLPLIGTLVGLTSALMIAIISIQLRDMGRTEAAATTVFWFSLLSAIPLGLALPLSYTAHNAHQWGLLFAIGTCGGIGQIALSGSLRHAPVSTVVGMDYIALLWSTLYGWLIWDMLPVSATWIGAPLIVASGLYIVWREHRLHIERLREIAA